ncbi:hypothetical protein Q9966_005206 [Columba livia]|nr:hypothetical protein Q9966_005206 [Columba livia]
MLLLCERNSKDMFSGESRVALPTEDFEELELMFTVETGNEFPRSICKANNIPGYNCLYDVLHEFLPADLQLDSP